MLILHCFSPQIDQTRDLPKSDMTEKEDIVERMRQMGLLGQDGLEDERLSSTPVARGQEGQLGGNMDIEHQVQQMRTLYQAAIDHVRHAPTTNSSTDSNRSSSRLEKVSHNLVSIKRKRSRDLQEGKECGDIKRWVCLNCAVEAGDLKKDSPKVLDSSGIHSASFEIERPDDLKKDGGEILNSGSLELERLQDLQKNGSKNLSPTAGPSGSGSPSCRHLGG